MTPVTGSRLSPALVERLSQRDLPGRLGVALPFVTLDGEGRPHPMLVSYLDAYEQFGDRLSYRRPIRIVVVARQCGREVVQGRPALATVGTGDGYGSRRSRSRRSPARSGW